MRNLRDGRFGFDGRFGGRLIFPYDAGCQTSVMFSPHHGLGDLTLRTQAALQTYSGIQPQRHMHTTPRGMAFGSRVMVSQPYYQS